MSEPAILVLTLLAGLGLGTLFFGGLWWTVGRGLASPQPALWFLGSMLARMGVLVTGFLIVGGHDWRRWALCLTGAMLARAIVNRVTRLGRLRPLAPGKEVPFAP
jgi:F1F0 ATPase subunit 2